MHLLLVEDEQVLGQAMVDALQRLDNTVDWVCSGAEGRAAAQAQRHDAVLLDLGLPDLPGEVLLREWRAGLRPTPVIVLTARGQVEDRVKLLDLGADDYLVKPVDLAELQARLRAVVRRVAVGLDRDGVLSLGPLSLFRALRRAQWRGEPVDLTGKEYDVLEALVLRQPQVVSRRQLEEVLYGWDGEVESNAIEVYIHFLRRKLEPGFIATVRGRGYQVNGNGRLLPVDIPVRGVR